MVRTPVVEAIGYRPGTGGRIVEFGTVKFGGVSSATSTMPLGRRVAVWS